MNTMFFIAIHMYIQPWVQAGKAATHIMDEIYPFLSSQPHESEAYISGVPDANGQAYIYINGLMPGYLIQRLQSHAEPTHNTSIYRVEWLSSLLYKNVSSELQLQLAFNPTTTNWDVIRARGVSTSSLQLELTDDMFEWDFRDCHSEQPWNIINAHIHCIPQKGIKLDPTSADPQLHSPHIEAGEHAGWTEVIVTMRFLEASKTELIQLYWANDTAPWWDESRSWVINLPSDTTSRNYHFFIPPGDTPIHMLRLDPINAQSSGIIERIIVKPVL